MTTESLKTEDLPERKKPFFVRVISIAAMVMGFTGVLFFGSIAIYLISDSDFAESLKHTYYNKQLLWLYLLAGVVLHIALFYSGVAVFRLKKQSLWLFPVSSVALLLFAEAVDKKFFLVETILVVVLALLLFAYRKKLN